MSAYIDAEINGVDEDTGEAVAVFISGDSSTKTVWLEMKGTVVEVKARELAAALAFVDYIDG
jgi:hypothetical protein